MRIRRHLLPTVRKNNAKKGMGFVDVDERYEAMPKRLLRVTAHLISPVVLGNDGVIHLDALIGTAIAAAHPCYLHFDNDSVFPMPLEILWLDGNGYPLWAATDLRVVGDRAEGREYWHKRYPVDKAQFSAKMNANTTAGRNREYRVPMQTIACERMEAACIGNQEELERLLPYITHVGKKGAQGFGRVAKWTVELMDDKQPEMLIANNRTIPLPYARDKGIIGIRGRKGWTVPYFYAPRFMECISP